MAYSGEGNLIEGQIEGDPNKTVIPVAVDSDGHLIIDLDASTITIGTVDQGSPNTPANAWPVKLVDAGGVNEAAVNGAGQVSVNVGNFPATQAVTGPLTDTQLRASPVPISGTITATPSGTQNVNIVSTIAVPVTDNGSSLTVDGVFFQATQPISAASLPLPSGASTAALQTQPGVDIGDVTVNNASGAAAVNIQDGGNSITVDGTLATTFPSSSTATLSNVSASASSVTLLASNANRKMATFFNDSTSTLSLKFGATASATSFTVNLIASAYYELPLPVYTGIIDGIWTVATGAVRVTELT